MAFLNGRKFNVILKFYSVTIRYQGQLAMGLKFLVHVGDL